MQKPNILLIMADQLRGDWIGCAGTDFVDTPNIDAIAAQGVRFPKAICNSPVCAPSRISMATGVYPNRLGALNNKANLRLDQPTYYQALRKSGYRVGVVGKTDLHKQSNFVGENGNLPIMYHFGFTDPLETEGKGNAARTKNQSTRFEGTYEEEDMRGPYQKYLKERGVMDKFAADYRYRYTEAPVWYAAESALSAEDFHDSFIGEKSCDFLEKVSAESPWHLFVSFVGPHDPWDPPSEYVQRYQGRQYPASIQNSMAQKPAWIQNKSDKQSENMTEEDCNKVKQHYAGAITLIDDWVGKILEILQRRGMQENTVVIFCADHGEMLGDHGLFQKSVMYEGALRVPMIISDPRNDRKGTHEALVELVDLYPTILELAGVSYDSDKLDGKSLVPLISSQENSHKEYQISCLLNTRMICDGRFKFIENHNDVSELYDLEHDPQERINLFDQEPEIAGKLRSQLVKIFI